MISTDSRLTKLHSSSKVSEGMAHIQPSPMPDEFILETHGLIKEFKGFRAVDGVDLRVRRGDIHALIGPNGAGKTTCFNLLTKFIEQTSGSIHFKGKDISDAKPAYLARNGLVRSFQISATFPNLTVLENVRIALVRSLGQEYSFWRNGKSLNDLDGRSMELLSMVGLEGYADVLAIEMPYGRKRALEIATTLALDPELMLLDEPTQGMGHEDVEVVMELIARVAKNRTILMVEHNMKVVAGISNQITVLARGSVLAEGTYKEISSNPQVIEAYMGSAHSELEGDI